MNFFLKKGNNVKCTEELLIQKNTGATLSFPTGVALHPTRLLSKCAHDDEGEGVDGAQQRSVLKVLDDASTGATLSFASGVAFRKKSAAFTLFEVLIALAVFAFSVAGLVISLDSMVKAVLETRERAFLRLALESRLAYNMIEPPMGGDRTLTINGISFLESLTKVDMTDANNKEIPNIYRLKISSSYEKATDSAEILLFPPQ